LALGFSNFTGCHLIGDFATHLLATLIAPNGSEVEPLMRFDEIDIEAAGSAAIRNTEIEIGIDIAHCCFCKFAFDQIIRSFKTVPHVPFPFI